MNKTPKRLSTFPVSYMLINLKKVVLQKITFLVFLLFILLVEFFF